MTYHEVTTAQLLRTAIKENQKSLNTAIPGYLIAFEPDTQLAQLQIGIKRVDTQGNSFNPPILIECPVHFPGGKFAIEYELQPDDEGLIVFSQRCIDAWQDTGGIAENPILRFHDYNDAMFIPGIRSQTNVLGNFQNNGVRLRNEDGTNYVWLKNDGTAEISVTSLTVNGNLIVNGAVDATDDITTDSNVVAQDGQFNAANFNTHIHPAGTPPGNTGTPL